MTLIPTITPGMWRIYRVDGAVETHISKPGTSEIKKLLGYDVLDVVVLTVDATGQADVVMLVSDTGLLDNLPINEVANGFMQQQSPGYPHFIHGDVALVNDQDFE